MSSPFSVIKTFKSMVKPAKPTPQTTLNLSAIDNLPGLRCKVRTYHVFSMGAHEPGKFIREAISKALVHYYPIAGRLTVSKQGELQINCTGDGIFLSEAFANCTLEQVNYLSHPLHPAHHQLLPDPRRKIDPTDILVLIQVTEFACGGFVMGLVFCHSICDGLGAAQFLKSVAEFARGLIAPTVTPVWLREAIPTRANLSYTASSELPQLPIPSYKLEQLTVGIPMEQIGTLKNKYYKLTGERCSMFEVLAAKVWQCRTRAINLESDEEVKLVFFANVRNLVDPELPSGFYGNCFFPVSVTAMGSVLAGVSEIEVINMIKESKKKLPEEFGKWVAGEGDDPYLPTLSYKTLFVSEWSRLGFGEVDYGWGKPLQVVPLTFSDIIPVCILGSPPAVGPAPVTGARLITQCVEEKHVVAFREQMNGMS
ncbi:putative 10-deacetylbaccatin III 10-O-acetyltransferase [Dioscorea sansibarensis]